MAKAYGLNPVDESLSTYVHQTFNVFTLAKNATVKDNGCNPGVVVSVGPKTLKKGTDIFGDKTRLNAKYGKGGWSATFRPGWKLEMTRVRSRAMTTCSNPISNWVWVWIWLPPKKHHHKPPPHVIAPSVSAQAQACVEEGGATGIISGSATNPNKKGYDVTVVIDSKTGTFFIPAGGSTSFTFSGFAPGTYTGTAHLNGTKKTATFSVTVEQCAPPPSMSAVMNSIQEVYNDGEIYPNLSGMLNSPAGDTISCALSVVNDTKDGPGAGSIQDPTSYKFTSTGNNQVVGTWVYVAPDDNGGNASVGWDYLKLVCKDLSNSKVRPATAYSLEFEVQAAPPQQ
jgi:hypothetical protein